MLLCTTSMNFLSDRPGNAPSSENDPPKSIKIFEMMPSAKWPTSPSQVINDLALGKTFQSSSWVYVFVEWRLTLPDFLFSYYNKSYQETKGTWL